MSNLEFSRAVSFYFVLTFLKLNYITKKCVALILATGTGKSLSLICGALSWLSHYEENRIEDLREKIHQKGDKIEDDGDDWIAAESKKIEIRDNRLLLQKELDFLLKKIEKIKDLRKSRQRIYQKENRKTESDFDELFRDTKEFQEVVKELNAMKSGFDTGT